ncbi:MAG: linear amide C-N hydrolase [Alistipes sp.]|nr:linear amide C-N hydrolase [Alistipes sp.]
MTNLLLGAAACCGGTFQAIACTGISLTAADGSYVQARTIEWARGVLQSEYVVIPRGEELQSFTPTGANGLRFTARYGVVGLSVVMKEFIAEGINEAGLSAGLFFFPRYGGYETYEPAQNDRTLGDLQVVGWMLSQFATIDEVKAAIGTVRIVGLEQTSVVHWRIGEPSGRQVVLEIVGGVPHFYENEVGVLTNAPGFEWQLTNLDNYVNLYPGDAPAHQLSGIELRPLGGNSGFLGIPGDATPPSRFVRAAFYRATAPQRATAFDTVQQCFHLLNNFDIPIGIEHPAGEAPNIPSATQWTSAIDLSGRKVYYKTAYDNSIRCIDLAEIDFARVKYRSYPLDKVQEQPVVKIKIPSPARGI